MRDIEAVVASTISNTYNPHHAGYTSTTIAQVLRYTKKDNEVIFMGNNT